MTVEIQTRLQQSTGRSKLKFSEFLIRHGTITGFLAMCIVFAIMSDVFLTMNNITNIILQSTMLSIVSFGLTLVIIVGGFDVSLSSVVPASGVLVAYLLANGWSIPMAILVAILPGVVIGALNAFTILRLGVPDFIATLGMMSVVKGIVYMGTEGRSVWQNIPNSFLWLGRGHFGGIPVPVLIMFCIFGCLWVLMSQTKLGRRMYAVGGNVQAARLSGINVIGIKAFTFVLAGLLSAICGVLLAARLGSGQPAAGGTYFLDGIAAVFLGQSMFSEGQPHLFGTLLGVLIIGTMNNGFVLLGVSYFVQDLVKGLVIIMAVALSTAGSIERIAIGI